jgi:DNA primase
MRDQVSEVKSKIDIVDIISEYIHLKKAGTNFKGLCPFHSEKSPSFMVNPELQIFKCFGCGESGDVFSFLEKYEGMEFYETLKYLANKVGIPLQQRSDIPKDNKERLFEINNLVHRFYQYMLLKHPLGKSALEYLKKRGLVEETIKEFQLGFAPDDFHALEKVLVSKKKATMKELEAVGLVFERNSRGTDRFRGRIMFPLFDHRGNLCGFAGRILPELDTGTSGKYINSPETTLYHKSQMLFALYTTRKNIREEKEVILVEGEMDAIASWQAGVKNVVAIKGSALTQEQVKLLSRFTKKIVFCLDTDFAGDAAARRGIQIAENEGMEVRVAQLTGYKDPGEAAIENSEDYKKAIKNAVGVWDFIIESVVKKYKTIDGENKAKISRELIPLLSTIEDSIVRSHYIGVTAQKLNVPIEAVSNEVEKKGQRAKPVEEKKVAIKQKTAREKIEERIVSLALSQNPQFLLLNENIQEKFETPIYKRIVEEFVSFAKENSSREITAFAQIISPELKEAFEDVMLKTPDELDNKGTEEYNTELLRLYGELELLIVRSQLGKLTAEIKVAHGSDKKQKLLQAKKQISLLQKLQSQLENK